MADCHYAPAATAGRLGPCLISSPATARSSLAGSPLNYSEPIEIVGGKGCRVTDSEGHSYLDFFAGILTNMLGYDVAEVREAVERQLATGIYHTSTLYLIRSQVELAEKIAKLSGIPDAKVFFTNSGSEANETALAAALVRPQGQPGPRDAQLVPRPHLRHRRHHGQRQLEGEQQRPVRHPLPARRRPAAGRLPQPQRRRVHRRLRRGPARRCWPPRSTRRTSAR